MNELFRRAAPGVALAGAALATVGVFDPALHAKVSDLSTASAPAGEESTESTQPQDGSGSSDSGSTDSGSTDSGSTDSGSTDSGSTDSGTSGGTSTGSSADCSASTTTRTGEEAMTRWGPVQVRMTFAADGSVCSVEAIAYPDNDPHSSRINATAIPTLDARAASEGVSFDAVSGATYTSEAYRQSMQSILDSM